VLSGVPARITLDLTLDGPGRRDAASLLRPRNAADAIAPEDAP
jgi:hypothetical protein